MTGRGHRRVHIVTAPAVWVALLNVTSPLLALIATTCYLAACRLPDHLEWRIDFETTLVPHRTITHWGVMWFAIAACGYGWMTQAQWMPVFPYTETVGLVSGAVLFGCAIGSLMHLLMDAPDYMGIPWLLFWVRHRLCWWRSGRFELPIVIVMGLLSALYVAAEGPALAGPVLRDIAAAI